MNKQKKEVKEITDAKLDQMLNYVNFGNLKKNKQFRDCLKFKSCYHVMTEALLKTKDLQNSKKVIELLYEKLVPEYLLEDHPVEIPDVARDLIKQQTNIKGTGKTGDQMDIEFAILFRENETKRKKAGSKESTNSSKKNKLYKDLYKFKGSDHSFSKNFHIHQMTTKEEAEMKKYVDRKFTERKVLSMIKDVKSQFKKEMRKKAIIKARKEEEELLDNRFDDDSDEVAAAAKRRHKKKDDKDSESIRSHLCDWEIQERVLAQLTPYERKLLGDAVDDE